MRSLSRFFRRKAVQRKQNRRLFLETLERRELMASFHAGIGTPASASEGQAPGWITFYRTADDIFHEFTDTLTINFTIGPAEQDSASSEEIIIASGSVQITPSGGGTISFTSPDDDLPEPTEGFIVTITSVSSSDPNMDYDIHTNNVLHLILDDGDEWGELFYALLSCQTCGIDGGIVNDGPGGWRNPNGPLPNSPGGWRNPNGPLPDAPGGWRNPNGPLPTQGSGGFQTPPFINPDNGILNGTSPSAVTNGFGPSGTSQNPVRYADGTVIVSSTDLQSGGFGLPWGVTRSWTNAKGYVRTATVGNGMTISEQPRLLQISGTNTLAVIANGHTVYLFDLVGSEYVARGFLQEKLTYESGPDEWVMTGVGGNEIRFYGFSGSYVEAQKGTFKSFEDTNGNSTAVTSHTNGRIQEVQRSYTSGGDTITESFVYTYFSSGASTGLIESVVLRRKLNAGSWVNERKVEYGYYDDEDHGNDGDLKIAVVKDGSNNVLDTNYYRYYKPGESGGYYGGLKYALYSESFKRLVQTEGANLSAIADEDLAPFADHYFEYDSQRRATVEVAQGAGCSTCNGGQGEFAYTYTTSGNSDGYNSWKYKTVEDLPDGNQNIVYSNYRGQVMLQVFKDTTTNDTWATFFRYDEEGRVLYRADPSAVSGYNDTYADLMNLDSGDFAYLRDAAGLITDFTYYASTTATTSTAGGATGYLQQVSIRNGEDGATVLQSSQNYIARTAGSTTIYLPASSTVYANTNGTGALTTSYAYTFFSGTVQVESQTSTNPASDVTTVFFDTYGRPTWHKDAEGFIHYATYDAKTGAVVKTITDVDTTETSDFANKPSGWTTPGNGGLHLLTTYEVDGLGRTTKETDANGNITYTVYNDTNDEIRVYPGWNTSTNLPTGPTIVMRQDEDGGYSEVLSMSATPNVTSNRPIGTEAISSLQSLRRTHMNDAGQAIYEDAYFSFNSLTYSTSASLGTEGTHFNRTELAYDKRGRHAKTVRADGTIYRTVFDGLGRPVSEWIGDNDMPVSGFWSPSNPADMIKIKDYEYDGGDVGDSLLTSVTDAISRESTLAYDFRGRLIENTLPDPDAGGSLTSPVYLTEYDNLGRVIREIDALGNVTSYTFDTDDRELTITMPDPDGGGSAVSSVIVLAYDSNGLLTSQTDPLGKVTTYEFDGTGRLVEVTLPDPDDGGSQTAPVTGYEYDGVGNLRFVTDPLGNVTEWVYDRINRLTQLIEEDPDGAGGQSAPVTAYAYSAGGLPFTVTDALNRVTTILYDAMGRRTKVTLPDPDGGGGLAAPETEYEYDAANRLITLIDALDKETTYEYDLFDNVVEITGADPDDGGALTSPVTTFDFDNAGQLLQMTDALSRVTDYDYDDLGRRITITQPDPDGGGVLTRPETTFTYDAVGNLTQQIDPLGNRKVYGFDNLYRTVAEKRASGVVPSVSVSTTTHGSSVSEVQRVGFEDSFEIFGGTFTLTHSGQTTSNLDWDATASEVQAALEALSNIGVGDVAVTKLLDSSTSQQWRIVFQGSLAGVNVAQVTVDSSSISAMGLTETEATDTQGSSMNEVQVVTLANATGGTFRLHFGSERTSALAYNVSAGTIETALEALTGIDNVSVTGSGPFTITFQGAQAGENVATLVPEATLLTNADLLTTTRFTYDVGSRLLSLTDPVDNVTAWEYDNLGRIIEETNELSEVRTSKYDAVGNMTERVDRLGRKIEYVYDNLYRNTSEKWYDGVNLVRTLSFAYSAVDELVSASDPAATYTYSYDALSRVTSKGQTLAGLTPGLTYENVYDTLSRRTELQAVIDGTDDFKNTYTYDNLSRLTRLQQQDVGGGNVVADKRIDFAYDASSAFTKISRYADQAATEFVVASHYLYDGMGRLQKLTHNESDTPASGWGTDPLAGYQYVYDAASRIESIDSYLDGLTNYTHDDTDQLTGADHTGQTDESYTYDANGNRTGGGYNIDPNNQMASDGTYNYTYDEEGNRLTKTKISNGDKEEYTWDHRNRLTKITFKNSGGTVVKTVDQTYDVFNQWIRRTIDPDGTAGSATLLDTFFSHEAGEVALQFDGAAAADLTNRYLWGPNVDQLLADEQVTSLGSAGAVIWTLGDHLGTVRDLATYNNGTDDTTVANHRRYDSYGKLISETNAAVDELFGFTGRALDDSIALQNNGSRWYDSSIGQWLSQDPVGFLGGDTSLSRYVQNQPTGYVDSTGLQAAEPTTCTTRNPLGPNPLFGGERIDVMGAWGDDPKVHYPKVPPELVRIQPEGNLEWFRIIESQTAWTEWAVSSLPMWIPIKTFDEFGKPVCYYAYGYYESRTRDYEVVLGTLTSARVNTNQLQDQLNEARRSSAEYYAMAAASAATAGVAFRYILVVPPIPALQWCVLAVGVGGALFAVGFTVAGNAEWNRANALLEGFQEVEKTPITVFVRESDGADGKPTRKKLTETERRWQEFFRVQVPCVLLQ